MFGGDHFLGLILGQLFNGQSRAEGNVKMVLHPGRQPFIPQRCQRLTE